MVLRFDSMARWSMLALGLGVLACSGSAREDDGGSGGGSGGSGGSGGAASNTNAGSGSVAGSAAGSVAGSAAGGSSSVAGGSAVGGSLGNGGQSASGGATNAAGRGGTSATGSGGSSGSGTAGGSSSGGTTGSAGATGACASAGSNQHPFGCKFAWGIADPGGSLAGYSYLQFSSFWADSSISAAGTYTGCGGCNWLKNRVASTSLVPAYYAYIIGFFAHANGIVDGNQTGSKKLTTDGAAFIKAHRAAIIDAYAWYAKQTHDAWPTKPLVWLLEGDFVQFTTSGQSSPLTYAELGQLASDITCAIKANMPNAVVAINHSSWNTDGVTKSYWGALKNVNYDLVWTTGVGTNSGFIEAATTSTTYNHATATYSYLHSSTGRPVLVDTSAGASAAGDSWSTASAADLNARISEGVIGANVTGTAPSGLSGNIGKLSVLSALPGCQ